MRPVYRPRPGGKCLLSAALVHAVLVAGVLLGRWSGSTGMSLVGDSLDCPTEHGTSAAAADCQALAQQLLQPSGPACLPAAAGGRSAGQLPWQDDSVPGAAVTECCAAAHAFLDQRCHCWVRSFGGPALAATQELAGACPPEQQQQQQGAGGRGMGRMAAEGAVQQQLSQQQQQQQKQQVASRLEPASDHNAGAKSTAADSIATRQEALAKMLAEGRNQLRQHDSRPANTVATGAAEAAAGSEGLPGGSSTGASASGGGEAGVHGGSADIRLYVGILSASSKREARDAIRNTWAHHQQVRPARLHVLPCLVWGVGCGACQGDSGGAALGDPQLSS